MQPQHPSSLYSDILRRIASVRGKENRLALLYGALAAMMICLLILLAAVLVEEIFSFGTPGRTAVFAVAAAGMLASLCWFVARPLLRFTGILKSAGSDVLAARVGDHFPEVRDRLLDAMQMYEHREVLQSNYSVDLIDASFTDLYRQ